MSRLDRAFVNCHWPSHSTWVLQGDSRKSSDHISLVLKANNINWGPIPFKAYNFWLEDEQFLQWIDEKLKSSKKLPTNTQLQSWRIFRSWIKEWIKEHKFDFSLKISTLESKLSLAEQADRSLKEKMAISRELIHSYKVKDSMTMQKARWKWKLEWETNTKFFHRCVEFRIRKNSIRGVYHNNRWITSPSELRAYFSDYFKNIFSPSFKTLKVNLAYLEPNKLDDSMAS